MGKSRTLPGMLPKLETIPMPEWGSGRFCLKDRFHRFLLLLPGRRQHCPTTNRAPPHLLRAWSSPFVTPLRPPQGIREGCRGPDY